MPIWALHPAPEQLGTMSNHYFEFRQMRIEQDRCAMKVSTDACIQGAWTTIASDTKRVLDIGCGTGLLSLMLAQRNNNIYIDALEIDPLAAQQAKENISNSKFSDQILVTECDAKTWEKESYYDLIICNPPFFSQSLKGHDPKRNKARHNDEFGFDDLLKVIDINLKKEGTASILLPFSEINRWEKAMSQTNLTLMNTLLIKPFEHQAPNRVVMILSKQEGKNEREELVIYQEPKQYSSKFTDLLRPFYLHL